MRVSILVPNAALALLCAVISTGDCTSAPDLDLPIAKIYEVDDKNRVIRRWTKIDSNYETVVENVESLRLQCTANHPVQWIYKGNGVCEDFFTYCSHSICILNII